MGRAKLTGVASIPRVIEELTVDEKLNLAGEYAACHTLAVPDMDIPSIYLLDGATGVNGAQVLLDFFSVKEIQGRTDFLQKKYTRYVELNALNTANLEEAREHYKNEADILEFVDHVERFRPEGKSYISFPSGVNIGAAFDKDAAYRIGEAIGWELRSSGVDLCMGPNVDIARDPLAGRGYEMYGEDPELVGETAVQVIRGIQKTGVGACAKHFLANNQETNRNTKDTHVSERVLRELYGRGFIRAIMDADVVSIMSAYNAINGEFTSYSRKLLTGWIREEWGFDGLIVCDWGAVREEKEKSLEAGMDLILCGPNNMEGCRQALQDGRFSEEVLNSRVEKLLRTIVWLKETQREVPLCYNPEEVKQAAYDIIVQGSVLLKNEDRTLPLAEGKKVAFYGKRSKEFVECGTGSTNVITDMHSNVYDEFRIKYSGETVYETIDHADVLVYTVTAPAGENADRKEMDIEPEDRERLPEILKEAKHAGLKTVVLLNIAGPVDMRSWIAYADSVLSVFIPGCMGGIAAADLLAGRAYPGGKLPVTFPLRPEDTPTYPNFPGEHNDVYYGEGLFVGYRSYDARKMEVMYPFGYGLSYTEFEQNLLAESFIFDTADQNGFAVPVRVKNTGSRKGSQVIQIYGSEKKPHVLRPEKELIGFAKTELEAGEEKIISVEIRKDALQYYDIQRECWVTPVGRYQLFVGTSSRDIFGEADLKIIGESIYTLSIDSTIGEILAEDRAVLVVDSYTNNMISNLGEEGKAMMRNDRLGDFLRMALISSIPDSVKLEQMLQELSEKLKQVGKE